MHDKLTLWVTWSGTCSSFLVLLIAACHPRRSLGSRWSPAQSTAAAYPVCITNSQRQLIPTSAAVFRVRSSPLLPVPPVHPYTSSPTPSQSLCSPCHVGCYAIWTLSLILIPCFCLEISYSSWSCTQVFFGKKKQTRKQTYGCSFLSKS